MSVFPGNSEILEIEELIPGEHNKNNNFMKPEIRREEKDRKSLASDAGNISSLEDDLNQLFEIFNRRASSHGSSHQNQAGTSKNTSKKTGKSGRSHSPGHGISERMNLKQALRGLCLSQASEMATMKRSMKSPRSHEAGRIMTMYRNIVVEDIISDHSQEDSKGGLLEISLVPEQTTSDSILSIPEKLPPSDLWASNRSSLTDKAEGPITMQNFRMFESNNSGNQISKSEKPGPGTSSSPPTANNSTRQEAKSGTIENGNSSASVNFSSQNIWTEPSQTGKHASTYQTGTHVSPISSSRSIYVGKLPAQKVVVAAAVEAGKRESKVDMLHQDKKAQSLCSDDFHDKAWDHNNKSILTGVVKISAFVEFSSQLPLTEPLHDEWHEPLCSSRARCGETSLDISIKMAEQNQKKNDTAHKEEHAATHSPRRSDLGEKVLDNHKNSAGPSKVVGKEDTATSEKVETKELGIDAQKDSSKTIPSTGCPKSKKSEQVS